MRRPGRSENIGLYRDRGLGREMLTWLRVQLEFWLGWLTQFEYFIRQRVRVRICIHIMFIENKGYYDVIWFLVKRSVFRNSNSFDSSHSNSKKDLPFSWIRLFVNDQNSTVRDLSKLYAISYRFFLIASNRWYWSRMSINIHAFGRRDVQKNLKRSLRPPPTQKKHCLTW